MQLALDAATTKRLLDEYMPIAGALARGYRGLELDDLLQIGRIAIIEAYLTHDPNKGANLTTWMRSTIRWRLKRYVSEVLDQDLRQAERTGTDPQLCNGADPEERFWQQTAVHALGKLPPRAALIVDARVHGESLRDVAVTLGVCHQRAHQEEQRALAQLRSVLDEEDEMDSYNVVKERKCHCGGDVVHAAKGDQMVTMHKKPTCAPFEALRRHPTALLYYLDTGKYPNRKARRAAASRQRRLKTEPSQVAPE